MRYRNRPGVRHCAGGELMGNSASCVLLEPPGCGTLARLMSPWPLETRP
jgi:hypothetical protein